MDDDEQQIDFYNKQILSAELNGTAGLALFILSSIEKTICKVELDENIQNLKELFCLNIERILD